MELVSQIDKVVSSLVVIDVICFLLVVVSRLVASTEIQYGVIGLCVVVVAARCVVLCLIVIGFYDAYCLLEDGCVELGGSCEYCFVV